MCKTNRRRKKLKTQKNILKKINQWEGNAMMVAGLYRLFTYLPWEKVPEKYKEFFPPEAHEKWDEDLDKYTEEELKLDVEAEIRAMLNVLAKRNVTNSLGIIPMILADLYVMDKPIGPIQGKLLSTIELYKENVYFDRYLAENLAMFDIFEMLTEIVKKAKLKLSFNLDQAMLQVVEAATKLKQDEEIVTPEVDMQVDQALKDYKKIKEISDEAIEEYEEALVELSEDKNEADV